MVSVAFAIRPIPSTCPDTRSKAIPAPPPRPPQLPIVYAPRVFRSKPCANLAGDLTPVWLQFCIATWPGADADDVDVVSGLSEPHGPDGAMAERGLFGTEISQSGSAGHVRQAGRQAGGGARTDLALVSDLCASGLRHRQRPGRQPGARGHRRGCLCDTLRLALALQEGGWTRPA